MRPRHRVPAGSPCVPATGHRGRYGHTPGVLRRWPSRGRQLRRRGSSSALERLLVDPDFLLRIERDGVPNEAGGVYALSQLEVASRLSFFLWSSVPDDELLSLAEAGRLTEPAVLEAQTRRLLADPRAVDTLVDDFSAQWLNLRRVGEVVVDPRRYPHYDETLLNAFRRENRTVRRGHPAPRPRAWPRC